MQIELKRIRTLNIDKPTAPGRAKYLAAASGLVRLGSTFVVVADDELSVGLFDLDPAQPGTLVRIIPGQLPEEHKPRKKLKPDFEAICILEPSDTMPNGGVLILPSGSKPNRTRGAVVPLGKNRELLAPIELRLEELYRKLEIHFKDLNIEGAVCVGATLLLLQRGNAASNQNALIKLDLAKFLADFEESQSVSGDGINSVHPIVLGNLNGVPLSFTDAALAPNGDVYFLAAAEATESTYDDGEFRGAVLGRIENDHARIMYELLVPAKPEGLWIEASSDSLQFFVVTDADDLSKPSELLMFKA